MDMTRARAAYAREHMEAHERLDGDGKVVFRQRVRRPDAPSMRQWARERFAKTPGALSPKLARVMRGGR